MLAKGNRKAGSSPEPQLQQEQAIFGSQLISQCWKLMHLRFWRSHSLLPIKTFLLCWACHYLTRVFRRALMKREPQDCRFKPWLTPCLLIAVNFEKLSSQATSMTKVSPGSQNMPLALAYWRNGGGSCFFPLLSSLALHTTWQIPSPAMASTTPMSWWPGVTMTRMMIANIYWALTVGRHPANLACVSVSCNPLNL